MVMGRGNEDNRINKKCVLLRQEELTRRKPQHQDRPASVSQPGPGLEKARLGPNSCAGRPLAS